MYLLQSIYTFRWEEITKNKIRNKKIKVGEKREPSMLEKI